MTQDPGSGAPMSERMQSLLSRAVEDQLSEQRQLAGALADVRAQLGQVTSQLESLRGGGGSTGPQLDQALSMIAGNVRDAVRLLGERLDGVARLVQQRGHDLAEQRAAIGELKTAVEGHTSALSGMTGGLAALPAFGERIDALQTGLGGLSDRLRGLEELTAAVATLHQRSDALDAGLRELRQAFTGVAARAAQLPGRDDLEAVTGRVAESVDGLGGRLSRLETSVPSLLERLEALAEAHEDTQASVDAVRESLAAATPATAIVGEAGELAGLRDEVAAMREQLELSAADDDDVQALMDRLDQLHEALLGSDGVVGRMSEQVNALAADRGEPAGGIDAAGVEEIVARAVGESEQRLAEHVDEAILTLAEALLRRRARQRSAGFGGIGSVLDADEIESAAMGIPDEETAASPLSGDEDADETADEIADGEDLTDDGEPAPAPRTGGTPWQTPVPGGPAPESVESEEPAAEEKSRGRKPWWRPGG